MNESAVIIDLQIADDLESDLTSNLPSAEVIEQWLTVAFAHLNALANETPITGSDILNRKLNPEVSIRIVSIDESQTLNTQYRQKDKATNVLSFESDLPDFVPSGFIGDLVICAQVVYNEAQHQNKLLHSHWAHMCVHGVLHLLGYDHISDSDATQMETLEVEILNKLGIDDPYQIG